MIAISERHFFKWLRLNIVFFNKDWDIWVKMCCCYFVALILSCINPLSTWLFHAAPAGTVCLTSIYCHNTIWCQHLNSPSLFMHYLSYILMHTLAGWHKYKTPTFISVNIYCTHDCCSTKPQHSSLSIYTVHMTVAVQNPNIHLRQYILYTWLLQYKTPTFISVNIYCTHDCCSTKPQHSSQAIYTVHMTVAVQNPNIHLCQYILYTWLLQYKTPTFISVNIYCTHDCCSTKPQHSSQAIYTVHMTVAVQNPNIHLRQYILYTWLLQYKTPTFISVNIYCTHDCCSTKPQHSSLSIYTVHMTVAVQNPNIHLRQYILYTWLLQYKTPTFISGNIYCTHDCCSTKPQHSSLSIYTVHMTVAVQNPNIHLCQYILYTWLLQYKTPTFISGNIYCTHDCCSTKPQHSSLLIYTVHMTVAVQNPNIHLCQYILYTWLLQYKTPTFISQAIYTVHMIVAVQNPNIHLCQYILYTWLLQYKTPTFISVNIYCTHDCCSTKPQHSSQAIYTVHMIVAVQNPNIHLCQYILYTWLLQYKTPTFISVNIYCTHDCCSTKPQHSSQAIYTVHMTVAVQNPNIHLCQYILYTWLLQYKTPTFISVNIYCTHDCCSTKPQHSSLSIYTVHMTVAVQNPNIHLCQYILYTWLLQYKTPTFISVNIYCTHDCCSTKPQHSSLSIYTVHMTVAVQNPNIHLCQYILYTWLLQYKTPTFISVNIYCTHDCCSTKPQHSSQSIYTVHMTVAVQNPNIHLCQYILYTWLLQYKTPTFISVNIYCTHDCCSTKPQHSSLSIYTVHMTVAVQNPNIHLCQYILYTWLLQYKTPTFISVNIYCTHDCCSTKPQHSSLSIYTVHMIVAVQNPNIHLCQYILYTWLLQYKTPTFISVNIYCTHDCCSTKPQHSSLSIYTVHMTVAVQNPNIHLSGNIYCTHDCCSTKPQHSSLSIYTVHMTVAVQNPNIHLCQYILYTWLLQYKTPTFISVNIYCTHDCCSTKPQHSSLSIYTVHMTVAVQNPNIHLCQYILYTWLLQYKTPTFISVNIYCTHDCCSTKPQHSSLSIYTVHMTVAVQNPNIHLCQYILYTWLLQYKTPTFISVNIYCTHDCCSTKPQHSSLSIYTVHMTVAVQNPNIHLCQYILYTWLLQYKTPTFISVNIYCTHDCCSTKPQHSSLSIYTVHMTVAVQNPNIHLCQYILYTWLLQYKTPTFISVNIYCTHDCCSTKPQHSSLSIYTVHMTVAVQNPNIHLCQYILYTWLLQYKTPTFISVNIYCTHDCCSTKPQHSSLSIYTVHMTVAVQNPNIHLCQYILYTWLLQYKTPTFISVNIYCTHDCCSTKPQHSSLSIYTVHMTVAVQNPNIHLCQYILYTWLLQYKTPTFISVNIYCTHDCCSTKPQHSSLSIYTVHMTVAVQNPNIHLCQYILYTWLLQYKTPTFISVNIYCTHDCCSTKPQHSSLSIYTVHMIVAVQNPNIHLCQYILYTWLLQYKTPTFISVNIYCTHDCCSTKPQHSSLSIYTVHMIVAVQNPNIHLCQYILYTWLLQYKTPTFISVNIYCTHDCCSTKPQHSSLSIYTVHMTVAVQNPNIYPRQYMEDCYSIDQMANLAFLWMTQQCVHLHVEHLAKCMCQC